MNLVCRAAARLSAPAWTGLAVALTLTLCSIDLFFGGPVWGACNIIPAARLKSPYVSTLGKVYEPLGVAGQRVTLEADGAGGNPLFERGKVEITLEFHDFAGGPSVVFGPFDPVLLPTATDPDPDEYLACTPAPTSPLCNQLAFSIPDTKGSGHADGLAGPTTIVAKDKSTGTEIVRIETLQLAPGLEDFVFDRFLVLPEANRFESTASGHAPQDVEVFAAEDLEGNILIPLNFSAQKQNTSLPIATLLAAASETPSATGGGIPGKIRDLLAGRNRQFRVFTLDGKPLPPLVRAGADGMLYGLADADGSVLRIAITEKGGASGGGKLFKTDMLRASYPGGPLRLSYRSRPGIDRAVPLASVRSSETIVAYTRDETYEAEDLNGDSDTDDMVAEVFSFTKKISTDPPALGSVASLPFGGYLKPALDVFDDYAAFLEPQPSSGPAVQKFMHHFFRSNGHEIGATGRLANNVARIDGESVAVSGVAGAGASFANGFYVAPKAFPSLAPATTFDALAGVRTPNGNELTEQPPITKAVVSGGNAVLLSPESVLDEDRNKDGDKFDQIVQFYGAEQGLECLIPLRVPAPSSTFPLTLHEAAATDVAMSDKIIVVTVSERNQGTDFNVDGDTQDDVVFLWSVTDVLNACKAGQPSPAGKNVGVAGDRIVAWGTAALFVAPEFAQNTALPLCSAASSGFCDLNDDGDPNDDVLVMADMKGNLDSPRLATVDFQVGRRATAPERFVALRVPETEQNTTDLNEDGDVDDAVLHIYFPDCVPPADDSANTKWAAIPCTFAACDARYPYRVVGDLVYFLTDDHQVAGSIRLAAVRADGCTVSVIPMPTPIRSGIDLTLDPFPNGLFGGPTIAIGLRPLGSAADAAHLLVAGDADGDGVFDPLDNCVERPNVDLLDVDDDGLGDRYCDPTPASCPDRPLDKGTCAGSDQFVARGLCVERSGSRTEFVWNWRPAATGRRLPDPGDPIRELPHYSLCIYNVDGEEPVKAVEAAALPWPECGEPPCWSGNRRQGFVYRSDASLLGTLDEAVLPPVDAAVPNVYARGHAENVALSAFGERNVVQLLVRQYGRTECWGSSHLGIEPLSACKDDRVSAGGAP